MDRIRTKGLIVPPDDLSPLLPYPTITEAQLYNAMLDVRESKDQAVIDRRIAKVCSAVF